MSNALLAEMPDVATEITMGVARQIMAKKEAILLEAITNRLGAGWRIDDLRGRVNSQRRVGQTFETLFLDGRPLVEFHDPVFEVADGKMHTNQNYRLL